MAQTLKEYLEEQRKAQKTPYFTNVQPDPWNPLREDAFVYEEEPFTAESEQMLGPTEDWKEPHPEFGGAPVAGELTPPPAPKPTAETVIPGGEIPEEIRKKHGLSKEAHYAFDQKIPKPAEAIPPKPTEEELELDFEDRRGFRKHSGMLAEKKFGINPLTYNLPVAMEEAKTGDRMQKLYQKVLMGQNSWTNRENLTTEQKKLWAPHENRMLAQIEAENESNLKLARSFINDNMKNYDNVQKEAATIPTGIRSMLKSIRQKKDPDTGKFYTEIKPGEEAYMIEKGQEMVRTGNMTAAQAISTIQTKTLDAMEKKEFEDQQVAEAMAALPAVGKWTGADKDAVDAGKVAVARLKELKVPDGEIIAELQALNWPDNVLVNLFPDEAKPVVAQKTTSAETVPRETKGAENRMTPGEIVKAEQDGTITREQARQEFSELTGV